MSNERALIDLFHHRWAVPVLAELHRSRGSRMVTLAHRTGAARESLRRALDDLAQRGLVERNPGYGHPLRPEYVLTAAGARLGPACVRLIDQLAELGLGDVGMRKWSMPVVAALDTDRRFGELRAMLPGVTPRALTQALKTLSAAEAVERSVEATYPPRTSYRLSARVRPLRATLLGLARAA